ncbi:MAG TPA: phosphopantetheine-binding protein [Solirubrobacteraceae bacterium]|jgi:D-alanine--poly(phosphoribitol) ligase subunit 2|nr:phosphopantetheine-binding protein [Solirubrobacteraceae bacterium]
MDREVKQAVLDFFAERAPLPGESEGEQLAVAYLDAGLISSMAIVELVVTLEDRFGVRFEPEDMQSEDFRTVGGLIEVVSRLRAP